MGILEIISGVMLIACSVVITLLVLAQQPSGGMGAVAGGDMFQNVSSRSQDAKIANVTKYAGLTSNMTRSLSSCSGFTLVEYVHLHGISATSEELAEIESMLKAGVIL